MQSSPINKLSRIWMYVSTNIQAQMTSWSTEESNQMERKLCEAAITGKIDLLHKIIGEDPLILDKVVAGCFDSASPLHVAASKRELQFVEELLRLKPELTEVLDSQQRSALHLASAKGYGDIVKVLVKANPKMCLVRDRDSKNPVHVVAVEGYTDVLEELVNANQQAARFRADQSDTILHLCVKHNQLESLKKLLELIKCQDFVNARNGAGNTVLHLAMLYEHFKIAHHVLDMEKIQKILLDVNATNAGGLTAMDILVHGSYENEGARINLKQKLQEIHAKQSKIIEEDGNWISNTRESLKVVASLIATMAFQAGVTPPGGVWSDNSDGHRAGEAVMAYNYPNAYPYFLSFNTIGFVASLSTILLLISGLKFKNKATMWILTATMWLAITSMAITYAFSYVVVTPKSDREPLRYAIKIAVIVWFGVMTLFLVKHTLDLVKEIRGKMKKIESIMKYGPQSLVVLLKRLGGQESQDPIPSPHSLA